MKWAWVLVMASVLLPGVARAGEDEGTGPRMPLQRASLYAEAAQGRQDLEYRIIRREGLGAGVSVQGSILGVALKDLRLRGGDLLAFSLGGGGMSSDYKDDGFNFNLSLTAGLQLWYLLDRRVDVGLFGGLQVDYLGAAGGAFQHEGRAYHYFAGVGLRRDGFGVELSAGELGFFHLAARHWLRSGRAIGLEYTHLQQPAAVGDERPKAVNALRLFWETQL